MISEIFSYNAPLFSEKNFQARMIGLMLFFNWLARLLSTAWNFLVRKIFARDQSQYTIMCKTDNATAVTYLDQKSGVQRCGIGDKAGDKAGDHIVAEHLPGLDSTVQTAGVTGNLIHQCSKFSSNKWVHSHSTSPTLLQVVSRSSSRCLHTELSST